MKIGYVSTNLRLGCTSASTFRLASFTEERFRTTVGNNLLCLLNTLRFNVEHGIYFFRVTSDIVPFASHPVCTVDWQTAFARSLRAVGRFAVANGLRLSTHPGQYTLLNSPNEPTAVQSVAELHYHAQLFDAMGLDSTHKIQIHVGGVYGDKSASLGRFAERYHALPDAIRRRLVVENDDRLYTVRDCRWLADQVGMPIVFDNLHHALNNNGETLREAFEMARETWRVENDGLPICDYSDQDPAKRPGSHAASIDLAAFAAYLDELRGYDFDVMLEIKDKDASALAAVALLNARHRQPSL